MNNPGLIIIYPYGDLIIQRKKTMIIKSRKFNISNQNLLLIENKKILGIIKLDDFKEVNLHQIKKLYKYHLIPEADHKKWWNKEISYAYNINYLHIFKHPILINYTNGPQVIIHNFYPKAIYIGTSGFVKNPNEHINYLNSVEINHTFYKYPANNFVNKLSNYKLIYSIKVNQLITHYHKLHNIEILWKQFYNLFKPIYKQIHCFLFQFHKNFLPNLINIDRIKKLSLLLNKNHKYVMEFRNELWNDHINMINNLDIIYCSNINLFNVINNTIYIRLNGTTELYKGNYSNELLKKIYNQIAKNQINYAYIYFNNTDENDNAWKNANTLIKKFNKINAVL